MLRDLEEEAARIEWQRQLWAVRFEELDSVVEEPKRKRKPNGSKESGATSSTVIHRNKSSQQEITRSKLKPWAHMRLLWAH